MQTLILASNGQCIENPEIDRYLPKPLRKARILFITTASKKVDDTNFVDRMRQKMAAMRLSYTEFDIAGKSEEELRSTLGGSDIAYVEGGNAFYLLKAIRETAFEKVIKEAIECGLVYWGVSAGAYVACPSIVMATWPNRNLDRCGITDYAAMGLTPFLIQAHYTPEKFALLKEKSLGLSYPIRALSDTQTLAVQDGKVTLLGGGEEKIFEPENKKSTGRKFSR